MLGLFKSNDQIVKEIHSEFDTAQERLLEQANKIIEDTENLNFKKGEQLVRLGFTSSEEAKFLRERAEEIQKSGKLAQQVVHYKDQYPFLRFLTQEELERICEKYSLIFAPVSAYKKNVPQKNLDEIEKAQPLNPEDMVTPSYTCKVYERNVGDQFSDEVKNDLINGHHIAFAPRDRARRMHTIGSALIINNISGQGHEQIEYDINDFTYKGEPLNRFTKASSYDFVIDHVDESELFIAAPNDHFDLSGLDQSDKKSKKGWYKMLQKDVDDPIVFRWVKGGLQVITKWGLEADDPALQVGLLN